MSNIVSLPIENGFKQWIDITDPSTEELTQLANQYKLHPVHVKDCLDASHLPKYEESGDSIFIIARSYDSENENDLGTVQSLTRKIAIFITTSAVLTIHRKDQPWIHQLREKWRNDSHRSSQAHLVNSILARAIRSYTVFIERISHELDKLEEIVFLRKKDATLLEHSHRQKKMISTVTRVIQMMEENIPLEEDQDLNTPYRKDLEDKIRRTLFALDDLELRIEQMLQLYLAIESQKNNEVMRILTLFSAFFLPLTFIVGIYGMNFSYIPELNWRAGYPIVLGAMALISVGIWIWFKRKGWIEK